MKDNRSLFKKKLAALKHYYLWFKASANLELILVSEFPKSGGTWYCQMLSHYLQLPYPRNRTPRMEKSVLHGHYYFASSFNKPVCVLRDGRDALVSYYHHMYFGNSILPERVFEKYRSTAPFKDFQNVEGNLPAYIEYMFTKYRLSGRFFSWTGFVNSFWNNPNVVFVKYEDLLVDPANALGTSIKQLMQVEINNDLLKTAVDKYSFQSLTQREPGEENKKDFLRKGIAGDWKNYFTKEACEVFNHYAGNELVLLGYEKNKNWY